MFYVNFGTLTAKEHFTDIQKEIINTYLDTVEVTENKINIEELYGDIEEDLFSMISALSASGASISGMISYYGDYEGAYVFTENLGKTLSQKERMLYEMPLEDLLDFISGMYPVILPFHLPPHCDMKRLSYALYVNDWRSRYPVNYKEANQSLKETYKTSKIAVEYLPECPTAGKAYAPYKSFTEFLRTDYLNTEYMYSLLQEDSLISEYLMDKEAYHKP